MIQIDKKYIIYGAIGLILAVAALVFFMKGSKPAEESQLPSGNAGTGAAQSDTYKPVTGDVKVPDANSQVDSDTAKPSVVKSVGANDLSVRTFNNVLLENDTVSPEKIVVKLFDIVTINFSAVDKTYDMVQPDNGLSWTVPKGGGKSLQFQGTTPGQFTFYCVSCGGPDKGPVGYFIVVPK